MCDLSSSLNPSHTGGDSLVVSSFVSHLTSILEPAPAQATAALYLLSILLQALVFQFLCQGHN